MYKICLVVFSWLIWILSWFDCGIYWFWLNFDLVICGYYDGNFEGYGKWVVENYYKDLR